MELRTLKSLVLNCNGRVPKVIKFPTKDGPIVRGMTSLALRRGRVAFFTFARPGKFTTITMIRWASTLVANKFVNWLILLGTLRLRRLRRLIYLFVIRKDPLLKLKRIIRTETQRKFTVRKLSLMFRLIAQDNVLSRSLTLNAILPFRTVWSRSYLLTMVNCSTPLMARTIFVG